MKMQMFIFTCLLSLNVLAIDGQTKLLNVPTGPASFTGLRGSRIVFKSSIKIDKVNRKSFGIEYGPGTFNFFDISQQCKIQVMDEVTFGTGEEGISHTPVLDVIDKDHGYGIESIESDGEMLELYLYSPYYSPRTFWIKCIDMNEHNTVSDLMKALDDQIEIKTSLQF